MGMFVYCLSSLNAVSASDCCSEQTFEAEGSGKFDWMRGKI